MRPGPRDRRLVVTSSVCLCVMLAACSDSDLAVLPNQGLSDATISDPPGAPQLPVPNNGPSSLAHLANTTVDDAVVTSTCGVIEVEASRPERIGDGECREEYLVDVSVATAAPDVAILDMFQSYDVADWRVEVGSRRVRHELSLVWRPYRDARYWEGVSDQVLDVRNITQPLTVRVCPEGPGAVLACSDTACDLYDDEDEVPPVGLPTQDVVVETPWGYDDIQDLREGSSLTVRVRYFLRTRTPALTIDLYRSQRRSSREFEIAPRYREVRNSQGFGTATFRIRAARDGIAQDPSVEEFGFAVSYDGPRVGCIVRPTRFQVRVRNR